MYCNDTTLYKSCNDTTCTETVNARHNPTKLAKLISAIYMHM